nr:immunoglobulin light chain junction region [Macaca mulatta]MOW38382.1 immunoglobulin light chain junction region [Macaca mulatta]MOY05003.1 immunoglobulin light chain junction region [Macaca mulatta]MOY05096.1 immunoglobulin light chain junction region [Macaca mulatta]MOY07181.1 immunoglobulin light chain junction region [Macaca mulatta]
DYYCAATYGSGSSWQYIF